MSFVLTTAVWGDWHVETFLKACLPSLLAPGNIPALRGRPGSYVISTSAKDRSRIAGSDVFKLLSTQLSVSFKIQSEELLRGNPHAVHNDIWREAVRDAADKGDSWVGLIPPDCFYAEGSIARWGHKFAAGKKMIFGIPLRVVEHTCLAAIGQLVDRSASVCAIAPRVLMKIAFENLSPLTLCYMRESKRFGHWPECLIYSVPGEGVVYHAFIGHCSALDPRYAVSSSGNIRSIEIDDALVDIATDSDDYAIVSLTPISHQVNWFLQPRPADLTKTAMLWHYFDAPSNRHLTRSNFKLHYEDITDVKWRPVVARAKINVMLTYLAKKFVWTVDVLSKIPGMEMATSIVAWALVQARLHRSCITRDALAVIIPTDAAFAPHGSATIDRLLMGSREKLERVLRNHCLVGDLNDAATVGHIYSLSGERIKVEAGDSDLFVDGHRVRQLAVDRCDWGKTRIYACDGVLGSLP